MTETTAVNNGKRTHKEIESPWTHAKYVIRELDPVILSIFSTRTETQEVKILRVKIQDVLEDLKVEENRQQQQQKEGEGKEDQSKLDAIQAQLQSYYNELQKLAPLDEKEFENRKKVVQFGLVQPKIKTDDDFLDLGKDVTFIYSNILVLSDTPKDYAEVIQALFRPRQSAGNKSDKGG